jgi:hypothetical protein
MADDIPVLPADGGVPVATDELPGGRQAQLIKLLFGDDGIGIMVSATNPLPTQAAALLTTTPRCGAAPINVSAAGDTQLLAGTTGQTIRLWKVFLTAEGGDVAIKFRDGTTDLHPAITIKKNGSFVLDLDAEPWFVTSAGNALQLNLSVAAQVSGRWYYTKS